MDPFLVLVLAALLGAYVFSLVRNPYTRCRWCRGRGTHSGSLFKYSHRVCARCRGSGRKPRLGLRVLRLNAVTQRRTSRRRWL